MDPWANRHRQCQLPFQLAFDIHRPYNHRQGASKAVGWQCGGSKGQPPPWLAPATLLPSTNLQHAQKYPMLFGAIKGGPWLLNPQEFSTSSLTLAFSSRAQLFCSSASTGFSLAQFFQLRSSNQLAREEESSGASALESRRVVQTLQVWYSSFVILQFLFNAVLYFQYFTY